jgi:hypothetical protein
MMIRKRWHILGSAPAAATHRLVAHAPTALAAILLALIVLKAALAVDLTYDSLSYHLPFAARRAHILVGWQFQRAPAFINTLTAYYDGFPVLADLIKGYAWRLTGWAEIVNLFGLVGLGAFFAYVRFVLGIGLPWVVIGVLAVPQIQTAAPGNYVDLPACAAFAIMLFSICDLYLRPQRFTRAGPWLILFFAAFTAAHIKLQTSVLVCLAMPFVLPPIWWLLGERRRDWRVVAKSGALLIAACLAIAGNLIKNLIRFGNPLYPIDLKIAGLHIAGPVVEDAWLVHGRPYSHLPEAAQWVLSLLEFGGFGGREGAYDNGMGNVPWESAAAAMGGFFAFLVIASLAFFTLAVASRRDRLSIVLASCLAIVTLVVANFPNSHNLRYEMYWMMFLIVSCLWLLERAELRDYLVSYRIVLFASLVFVTAVTGAVYFTPTYNPIQTYVGVRSADELLRRVITRPGEVICLEQGAGHFDSRFTIMFSPALHKELNGQFPYGVREGECADLKTISGWR